MKILYGVTGEGMGHAIRSKVVLDHLVSAGHEVEVIASNRAATFLKSNFEVRTIHGLHIVSEENRVVRGKTLWSNITEGIKNLPKQVGAYFDLIDSFKPDAVISDFESFSYLYARAHDRPVFSVDNQQVMNRCSLPEEVIGDDRRDFEIVKGFVKAKLPFCDHYFIATFFTPEIRKSKTSLFSPILRDSILEREPSEGDHILVYQSVSDSSSLLDALRATGIECRIYGLRRDLDSDERDGNLVHRPFSETTFIDDLASARAVVASAGFTLMGECVYLRKPLLAVPIEGQFEQLLNGRYLAYLGYGAVAPHVDADSLETFLSECPRYAEALKAFSHPGNGPLFDAIDAELDRAAAGLY